MIFKAEVKSFQLQKLLLSIDSLTPDTADIRADLDKLYGITYIHWIPSHINIPGNEFADTAAKEAALLPDPESTVSVPYGVAKAITKQKITDEDPVHPVVSETYRGYVRKNDKVLKSRKDATLIAQLRSGHCLNLAHYKNRLDDKTSATCPECEEEEETVSHWLKCPATIRTRENICKKNGRWPRHTQQRFLEYPSVCRGDSPQKITSDAPHHNNNNSYLKTDKQTRVLKWIKHKQTKLLSFYRYQKKFQVEKLTTAFSFSQHLFPLLSTSFPPLFASSLPPSFVSPLPLPFHGLPSQHLSWLVRLAWPPHEAPFPFPAQVSYALSPSQLPASSFLFLPGAAFVSQLEVAEKKEE